MHDSNNDFPVPASAAPAAQPHPLRFEFVGSGSEYFRIWIVNALLTIVTLGIYSPWAKVRTMQYFYRNTRLDNASFDYHGRPTAILKGRAIVFALAAVFQLAGHVSMLLSLALGLALALVFPLLLVRSLRFRMANSSYRGLRFAFTGGDAEAYKVFLLWPALAVLTLYALAPLAHQRFKRYQHNHTRFGTAPFAIDAAAGGFYGVYLRAFGMMVAVGVLAAVVVGVLGHALGGSAGGAAMAFLAAVAGFYVALLSIGPFFMARLQNLVWNHTTLAPHAFRSEVRAGRLFFIFFTNLIATVFTLGLFMPFAKVRSTRYRVESMTMLAAAPLDAFVAGETQQVGALGDAAVDWYDIDIAL
ncbi:MULTISPECIES: YjgN family protein [Cupriavidus]|uniref:YjgN family protein n=1 Tax=Cupriavidus sp. WS TaxID=1312922 RepID=UPI0003651076|nr:YjgN family protein [Cupriavidus sp. WS]